MSFVFNPFTGKLDNIGSGGTSSGGNVYSGSGTPTISGVDNYSIYFDLSNHAEIWVYNSGTWNNTGSFVNENRFVQADGPPSGVTSPNTGDTFFNNGTGQLYLYNGTTWDLTFTFGSSAAVWGGITGDINAQTDLQTEFETKVDLNGDAGDWTNPSVVYQAVDGALILPWGQRNYYIKADDLDTNIIYGIGFTDAPTIIDGCTINLICTTAVKYRQDYSSPAGTIGAVEWYTNIIDIDNYIGLLQNGSVIETTWTDVAGGSWNELSCSMFVHNVTSTGLMEYAYNLAMFNNADPNTITGAIEGSFNKAVPGAYFNTSIGAFGFGAPIFGPSNCVSDSTWVYADSSNVITLSPANGPVYNCGNGGFDAYGIHTNADFGYITWTDRSIIILHFTQTVTITSGMSVPAYCAPFHGVSRTYVAGNVAAFMYQDDYPRFEWLWDNTNTIIVPGVWPVINSLTSTPVAADSNAVLNLDPANGPTYNIDSPSHDCWGIQVDGYGWTDKSIIVLKVVGTAHFQGDQTVPSGAIPFTRVQASAVEGDIFVFQYDTTSAKFVLMSANNNPGYMVKPDDPEVSSYSLMTFDSTGGPATATMAAPMHYSSTPDPSAGSLTLIMAAGENTSSPKQLILQQPWVGDGPTDQSGIDFEYYAGGGTGLGNPGGHRFWTPVPRDDDNTLAQTYTTGLYVQYPDSYFYTKVHFEGDAIIEGGALIISSGHVAHFAGGASGGDIYFDGTSNRITFNNSGTYLIPSGNYATGQPQTANYNTTDPFFIMQDGSDVTGLMDLVPFNMTYGGAFKLEVGGIYGSMTSSPGDLVISIIMQEDGGPAVGIADCTINLPSSATSHPWRAEALMVIIQEGNPAVFEVTGNITITDPSTGKMDTYPFYSSGSSFNGTNSQYVQVVGQFSVADADNLLQRRCGTFSQIR